MRVAAQGAGATERRAGRGWPGPAGGGEQPSSWRPEGRLLDTRWSRSSVRRKDEEGGTPRHPDLTGSLPVPA